MRSTLFSVLAGVSALTLMPLSADAGFFENLFGASDSQSQAPAADSQGPMTGGKRRADVTGRAHTRRIHQAKATSDKNSGATSDKPVLQSTTGLLEDPSLRDGDAVMTKKGIRIFNGKAGLHHQVEQFLPLQRANHLKKGARVVLAAIDEATHRDIGRNRNASVSVTGRSVSTAADRRPSFTDPNVDVRYVGP